VSKNKLPFLSFTFIKNIPLDALSLSFKAIRVWFNSIIYLRMNVMHHPSAACACNRKTFHEKTGCEILVPIHL
jgi:hypothetical protein